MTSGILRAKKYQRRKQVLALLHLIMTPGLLLTMILTGFSGQWALWAQTQSAYWPIAFALYFFIFSLFFSGVELPLAFYSGYLLEKKYHLSNQSAVGWMSDYLKRALLGFSVSLVLLLALLAVIRAQPQLWWMIAWAGFALFTLGVGKLFPVLIIPLFYKYGPVENAPLKERISALSARFGLSINQIHSLNLSRTTRKANAAFMGLGKTKRVVLSDTLLEKFSDDEIEAVLAHELGHYCHKDIWRMYGVNLLLTAIAFWLLGQWLEPAVQAFGFQQAAEPAAFPVLLLLMTLFSLVVQPLTHGISRAIENQADRFALQAMGSKDAFIRCMQKLAETNLADPDPHPLYEWFFYDHPAIAKRIARAEKFKVSPQIQRPGGVTSAFLIFLMGICYGAGGAFCAAEESALEKDFNARQKAEWKKFYLDDQGMMDMPQTSLAVDFFNQAVEAYQGQDYELAREALLESLRLNNRNAFAYELMGDMALEEHDLEAARENYRKAYLIQPSSKLQEKLEKAGREAKIDTGFQEYRTEHFLIRSKQVAEGHLEKLGVELERLFGQLVQEFGYRPREVLAVTLYERSEFEELTRLPHWVGGVYDGKIRLPAYSYGVLEQSFAAVAIHEMTHAVAGRLSHKNAPAWLQEGLAVMMEAQTAPRDFTVLRLALKTGSLLPMDQLMSEQKVTGERDALYASLFYEQAYSLIRYLKERYGMFKLKELLKAFAAGKTYDEALREVFKVDPIKLEKRWKRYLSKQFR